MLGGYIGHPGPRVYFALASVVALVNANIQDVGMLGENGVGHDVLEGPLENDSWNSLILTFSFPRNCAEI